MNHEGILTTPPTDLSRNEMCLYYTDTKECAEQYAMWAAQRCRPQAKKAILCLHVDKAWVKTLHEAGDLRYLTIKEFQQVVWWNYRGPQQSSNQPDLVKGICQT